MHGFRFTRPATVDGQKVTLHVSVNHNGDWSGNAKLSVIDAPDDDVVSTERWYAGLSWEGRERYTSRADVPAALLLRGDVDPNALPPRIARVLGAIIAESVGRYMLNNVSSAIDDVWLPEAK
jgi:hypothetical protein